ncbi:aminodeoxychorismate synthase component I [Edaphobacter bradus]|uniref:aminodeoxychorismate synthase component I n=1 Tax=Edaphobacter bradus TaxID=2259016 RepID=UPI0021DFF296|nr:aminodeoxychorismate synthase component I [Edaphobacter bradus]
MNHWTQLPKQVRTLAASTRGSVLLETSRFDAENQRSYLFVNPVEVFAAHSLDDIPDLFRRIEWALVQGLHVAGYLSYECGYHFERFNEPPLLPQLPLAWFGAYVQPFVFDHSSGRFEGPAPDLSHAPAPEPIPAAFAANAELAITEDEYSPKIERIKRYIEAGDTYQVNFTDSVTAYTSHSASQAFSALSAAQPVSYSALLNVAGHHILSHSPELFFRIDNSVAGRRIATRPMKGTMPRGLDLHDDELAAQRLASDEKNCSEHIMIVDLLRNDLGRVCAAGSVRVEDIFTVERYATLLQMTSTVSGTLRPGLTWYEIFRSLFPSGSITGAPKIRTMEIIRELESSPRGVYTGSIGHIAPDGSAAFNVAIRTLVLKDGVAHMGVGGGIVADSAAEDEYRECLLKASFLTRARHDFQLIETMWWDGTGVPLLSLHLDRLEASARYFGFVFDSDAAKTRIDETTRGLPAGEGHRLRLRLAASGELSVTAAAFVPDAAPITVQIADKHTRSNDVFLRHKTTHRELYDRSFAEAQAAGVDEVIFLNERGELTEGAISNLFLESGGRLLTPPLASGVLPGVYRRLVLETNPRAEERVLTIADLESADAVYLCNALRGMRRVKSLVRGASKSRNSDTG